jgi:hypothetical protein
MANIRLQYVKSYINRHSKVDHYFRRRGQKLTKLPGLPGSPEFMLAYNEAMSVPVVQAKAEPGASRTKVHAQPASPSLTDTESDRGQTGN